MPNHVTTRCTVTGNADELKRFRNMMIVTVRDAKGENHTQFDFHGIIPMPECLKGTEESTTAEEGAALLLLQNEPAPYARGGLHRFQIKRIRKRVGMPDAPIRGVAKVYLDENPEVREKGAKRLGAVAETGFAGWYHWSVANWGVKWNSYGFKLMGERPLVFLFDTAWAFPEPIFTKLADEFPSLHFHCLTFDEGWNFAGKGWHTPPDDEPPFGLCDADGELYELVHGCPPPDEDDEDEEREHEDRPD